MELTKGDVCIEWAALGEGLCGDYNPNDPDDVELLRFYVQRKTDGEWEDVEDASYCTCFPASATEDEMRKGLEYLMDNFYNAVISGDSVKKLGERLSWINLSTILK